MHGRSGAAHDLTTPLVRLKLNVRRHIKFSAAQL
jgi:hypothetical protein